MPTSSHLFSVGRLKFSEFGSILGDDAHIVPSYVFRRHFVKSTFPQGEGYINKISIK